MVSVRRIATRGNAVQQLRWTFWMTHEGSDTMRSKSGIVLIAAMLTVTGVAGEAVAQQCLAPTSPVIAAFLQNYMLGANNAVAYAWSGAHWSGASWAHRLNPNNTISYSTVTNNPAVSGPFDAIHSAAHPALGADTSHAFARAYCTSANCATAELTFEACVTNKVDSAGAGAYARTGAGMNLQSGRAGALIGVAAHNVPNRMTLYSGTGDVTGVWGMEVSLQKGKELEPVKDKDPLKDVNPWLAGLLGLYEKGQHKEKGHYKGEGKRQPMFAYGFELDAKAKAVKVVGPTGTAWKMLTAVQAQATQPTFAQAVNRLQLVSQTIATMSSKEVNKGLSPDMQASIAPAFTVVLSELAKNFKIEPCKDKDNKVNDKCHVASFELSDILSKANLNAQEINIPIFVEWPEKEVKVAAMVIEYGAGGREESLKPAP